jgi:3-hydroxyacyl-CoA dehydrogenase
VFRTLDAVARPGAILATNTSYLDVDAIAATVSRPEAVLGLHFFSPAQVMRLLEVVRGARTAPDLVATAMKLAKDLGKVGVVVGVRPGFVANAMQAQRQTQANRLILEGAQPQDVDQTLHDFGMPMGPFAMIDMAGLDIGWRPGTPTRHMRDRLCEMGRLGRKSGAGFYDYGEDGKPRPSPLVAEAIEAFAAECGVARRTLSRVEILERCIFASVNEGARILQEGKASRASDIDVAWVNGFGWPAYRGGPMYYADRLGLDQVLEGLKRYAAEGNPELSPAPLLERLVSEGRGFCADQAKTGDEAPRLA